MKARDLYTDGKKRTIVRKHSQEKKTEALRLLRETGLTHLEIGNRIGVPKNTVSGWAVAAGIKRNRTSTDRAIMEIVRINNKLIDYLLEGKSHGR